MNKAQTGAMGGAAGGALIGQMIGHSTEATLIGAAIGTMLGYIVGNEMDKYDRAMVNKTFEEGESWKTKEWKNPDTGNEYRMTPRPAYQDKPIRPRVKKRRNQYRQPTRVCRQAEIEAWIDGKYQKTYTTACRDANGQWVLQN